MPPPQVVAPPAAQWHERGLTSEHCPATDCPQPTTDLQGNGREEGRTAAAAAAGAVRGGSTGSGGRATTARGTRRCSTGNEGTGPRDVTVKHNAASERELQTSPSLGWMDSVLSPPRQPPLCYPLPLPALVTNLMILRSWASALYACLAYHPSMSAFLSLLQQNTYCPLPPPNPMLPRLALHPLAPKPTAVRYVSSLACRCSLAKTVPPVPHPSHTHCTTHHLTRAPYPNYALLQVV